MPQPIQKLPLNQRELGTAGLQETCKNLGMVFHNPELARRIPAWGMFPKDMGTFGSLHLARPSKGTSAVLMQDCVNRGIFCP